MGGEARGGLQVGREGEVRRVGVLNDSYQLLPEPLLLLYSTPAWDMTASIDVKSFFQLPCWKVQRY